MKAEIIGSTEVFEYPFRILWPVGGRSAVTNEVVLSCMSNFAQGIG
jgi:hypothetical protein